MIRRVSSLLFLISLSFPSQAQNEPKEKDFPSGRTEDFRDIAADLRCPTCTGLSVLDSDAPFSVQIKNEVKEQIVAGKNKNEILKFFTDRYGPWILREPPKEGVHLWAWLVPIGILLLGPVVIGMVFWARQSGGENQGADEYVPQSLEAVVAEMNGRLAELRIRKELR